jgi:hypothetical protein
MPLRRRAVLAIVAACAACTEPPGPGKVREGRLAIAPVFATSSAAAVDVGSVHLRLWQTAGAPPIVDTVVSVSPSQPEIDLQIRVPLSSEEESFLLSLVLLDPTGVEVYRDEANPTPITVSTSSEPTPVPVPIEYVGPGAAAVSVQIVETALTLQPSGTAQVHAEARDVDGQKSSPMPGSGGSRSIPWCPLTIQPVG